jgi:hypothetical protein
MLTIATMALILPALPTRVALIAAAVLPATTTLAAVSAIASGLSAACTAMLVTARISTGVVIGGGLLLASLRGAV